MANRVVISMLAQFPPVLSDGEFLYKYVIGTGDEASGRFVSLNDQGRLNQVADELKQEYAVWVFGLNALFKEAGLFFEGRLSLFFITDLSGKRTDVFPTYDDICNVELISEKLRDVGACEIEVHGGTEGFRRALRSKLGDRRIDFRATRTGENRGPMLPYLRACASTLKYLGKHLALALLSPKKAEGWSPRCDRLFVTGFPHLWRSPVPGGHEKYGAVVKGGDAYLVTLLADGLHFDATLRECIQRRRQLSAVGVPHFLLEAECTLRDVVGVALRGGVVALRMSRIARGEFHFRGIDVSCQVMAELEVSCMRVCRLLLVMKLLDRMLARVEANAVVYYLHEYAFGRAVSYVVSKHGGLRSIGMQHGAASTRKLLYLLAPGEAGDGSGFRDHVPLPDSVWAEDAHSMAIYEQSGYKEVSVMPEVPRIAYLDGARTKGEGQFVLIAGAKDDGPLLLESLDEEMRANPDTRYVFKPHPRSGHRYDLTGLPANVTVVSEAVGGLLPRAASVRATYSSVALEAASLGIPVEIVEIPGRVNQSPLGDPGYLRMLQERLADGR